MSFNKHYLKLIPVTCCLVLLIIDTDTAMNSAREGLSICIQTVIPSLFPFLFLSSLLSAFLTVPHRKHNQTICRLYHIPNGTEGILLSGLLGGYPVGAKCVAEATEQTGLSTEDAKRMIIFCNATGPAFLFGIIGTVFIEKWVPWCLWSIHLLSGIYVARLSSAPNQHLTCISRTKPKPLPQQLQQTIRAMSEICAWIILMRIGTSVVFKFCPRQLPKNITIFLSGIFEISNGCISLMQVENIGLRFVLCAIFLNFGGLCVALQTRSVASKIPQHKYIPGKCIQAMLGLVLAYIIQTFAFSKEEQVHLPYVFISSLVLICVHFVYSRSRNKKSCGIF